MSHSNCYYYYWLLCFIVASSCWWYQPNEVKVYCIESIWCMLFSVILACLLNEWQLCRWKLCWLLIANFVWFIEFLVIAVVTVYCLLSIAFCHICTQNYSWIWHPCTYPILVSRMINLLTNVTELSKNLLLKYCAFRLIIFTYILFFRELCCLCQQSLFWFKVTRFVIMITCVIYL